MSLIAEALKLRAHLDEIQKNLNQTRTQWDVCVVAPVKDFLYRGWHLTGLPTTSSNLIPSYMRLGDVTLSTLCPEDMIADSEDEVWVRVCVEEHQGEGVWAPNIDVEGYITIPLQWVQDPEKGLEKWHLLLEQRKQEAEQKEEIRKAQVLQNKRAHILAEAAALGLTLVEQP